MVQQQRHGGRRQRAAIGASLPVTEELAFSHLAIAFGPRLSAEDADEVTDVVRTAVASGAGRPAAR